MKSWMSLPAVNVPPAPGDQHRAHLGRDRGLGQLLGERRIHRRGDRVLLSGAIEEHRPHLAAKLVLHLDIHAAMIPRRRDKKNRPRDALAARGSLEATRDSVDTSGSLNNNRSDYMMTYLGSTPTYAPSSSPCSPARSSRAEVTARRPAPAATSTGGGATSSGTTRTSGATSGAGGATSGAGGGSTGSSGGGTTVAGSGGGGSGGGSTGSGGSSSSGGAGGSAGGGNAGSARGHARRGRAHRRVSCARGFRSGIRERDPPFGSLSPSAGFKPTCGPCSGLRYRREEVRHPIAQGETRRRWLQLADALGPFGGAISGCDSTCAATPI